MTIESTVADPEIAPIVTTDSSHLVERADDVGHDVGGVAVFAFDAEGEKRVATVVDGDVVRLAGDRRLGLGGGSGHTHTRR